MVLFLVLALLGSPSGPGGAGVIAVPVCADPGSGPGCSGTSDPGPAPAPRHDLHVSYGDLGIQGALAVLEIRIFTDDLEEALRRRHGLPDAFHMEASPRVDSLFLAYLGDEFVLGVGGTSLVGGILGSEEDVRDREPIWVYRIRYEGPSPISALEIRNTLLLEIFDDQRNILRVGHFPEGRTRTYYFARGEESRRVEF